LHVGYAADNLRWDELLRASEVVGDLDRYLADVRVAPLASAFLFASQISISDYHEMKGYASMPLFCRVLLA
jgi:hypothetical protein